MTMRTPYTSTQRLALRGLTAALAVVALHAAVAWVLLGLTGCSRVSSGAAKLVAEQHAGQATGAGATFTGPSNSAAPSTQTAQRRAAYYAPSAPQAARVEPQKVEVEGKATAAPPVLPTSTSPLQLPAPAPAWIDEKIETTFGQHQDAAGLVTAAIAANSWGKARWLGILCVAFSALALAWSHNNPEGYPLVAWKIGAVGLALVVLDPSPWWLLLLILPAAFYVLQKLNLLRLP